MIRIEIKDQTVSTRNGNTRGRDWTIRSQDAWAHTHSRNGNLNPYPEKISINLEDGQAPYAPGHYTLAPQSLYVGDFGRLSLGRPVLSPVQAKAAQAA